MECFRPTTNLIQCQISVTVPKMGQLGNPVKLTQLMTIFVKRRKF